MILLLRAPSEQKIEVYDFSPKPHIGLAYIASYLRSKDFEIRIIDGKFENYNINQIISQIDILNPTIIGLTAMTHEIDYTAEFAEKIKNYFPSIKIVIGGVHATLLPEITMEQYPIFDFLIYGEGEITFHDFLRTFNRNSDYNSVKGLVYRNGYKIIKNPPRDLIRDLDKLPFPAWDLFSTKTQSHAMITSRGCPFQCVFCARILGNIVRNRSIENVIEEIEYLISNFNTNTLFFFDETFTVSRKRILSLLNTIIERKLYKKVRWYITTRVDCVDMPLLIKLKKAGCDTIDFGVESGNNEILKIIKKNITKEQAIKAIRMAQKVGLTVNSYFILGHPFETRKTIMDTIKLAIKLKCNGIAFGIMTPYPKTEVYDMALKGIGGFKLISKNWRDYNKNLGNALELQMISRKWLEIYQLLAFLLFYISNFKVFDLFRLIKQNKIHFIAIIRKILRKK